MDAPADTDTAADDDDALSGTGGSPVFRAAASPPPTTSLDTHRVLECGTSVPLSAGTLVPCASESLGTTSPTSPAAAIQGRTDIPVCPSPAAAAATPPTLPTTSALRRMDFFRAVRFLDAAHADSPPTGTATLPDQENIRFAQLPEFAFPTTQIESADPATSARPPPPNPNFLGLLAPAGPLPPHLTEHARNRLRNHDDPTFTEFLNLFNNRFLALFYRAWALNQPALDHERPDRQRHATYLDSLLGNATEHPTPPQSPASPPPPTQSPAAATSEAAPTAADSAHGVAAAAVFGSAPAAAVSAAIPPDVQRYFAARLAAQPRNAESLAAILSEYFEIPVAIETNVGCWLPIPLTDRQPLSTNGCRLGHNTLLGNAIWDTQLTFRLHIGPLDYADYLRFLPGGDIASRLSTLLVHYLGHEHLCTLSLALHPTALPPLRLASPLPPPPPPPTSSSPSSAAPPPPTSSPQSASATALPPSSTTPVAVPPPPRLGLTTWLISCPPPAAPRVTRPLS